MKGIRKLGPGVIVPWYLPRRSRTQAFCCGTNLIDWLMKMTAMTRMTRGTANSMGFLPLCLCFGSDLVDDQAAADHLGARGARRWRAWCRRAAPRSIARRGSAPWRCRRRSRRRRGRVSPMSRLTSRLAPAGGSARALAADQVPGDHRAARRPPPPRPAACPAPRRHAPTMRRGREARRSAAAGRRCRTAVRARPPRPQSATRWWNSPCHDSSRC